MEQEFKIETSLEQNVVIIRLSGFLDANTIARFEEALEKSIENKQFKIVTDLSGLNYISSAGLGVYMGYIEDIRAEGGDIKLCCLSDKIFKVFDLLGFPELFDIESSVGDCLQKFNEAEDLK